MELEDANRLFIEQIITREITDAGNQDFLIKCLDRFPTYFWIAPASVGKYHPEDERKKGGLVLHTRRVATLVNDMVRLHELNFWQKDILVSAAILHDSFARGIPPRDLNMSDPLHPIYPRQQFPYNGFADQFIDRDRYEEIMTCISSHLGPWSPDPSLQSSKKLPVIFQTIDYLVSRSHIEVKI